MKSFPATATVAPSQNSSIIFLSSSSGRISMLRSPFARISPWERWLPKIKSSVSRAYAIPTAAASWPAERWAGPGLLYEVPLYPPVVLTRLSMVSNSRMTNMSRYMCLRSSVEKLPSASSSFTVLLYCITGISGKVIWCSSGRSTLSGSMYNDFGIIWCYFNVKAVSLIISDTVG